MFSLKRVGSTLSNASIRSRGFSSLVDGIKEIKEKHFDEQKEEYKDLLEKELSKDRVDANEVSKIVINSSSGPLIDALQEIEKDKPDCNKTSDVMDYVRFNAGLGR